MNINPVKLNHTQAKTQVGFGMSQIKLDSEVKKLVTTSKDAEEIIHFVKAALNDNKNYSLIIGKSGGGSYLYGHVSSKGNVIDTAYDKKGSGLGNAVASIKYIYQEALKIMDKEDDRIKAQEMLKEI